jgi:hypothetical protein
MLTFSRHFELIGPVKVRLYIVYSVTKNEKL